MRPDLVVSSLLLLLAGATTSAPAQSAPPFSFEFRAGAKVVQGTDTLRNAWAGGLNSPQFSHLDLNQDRQPDLVAFDRMTNRVVPFLSVATAAGRAWQFAPEYAALFPEDLRGWLLLRDYDCDGRPDLFTADASGSNIRVFRHEPDAQGRPAFRLITSLLSYQDARGFPVNIAVGGTNLPAIEDLDGDGRLDVLAYDFSSTAPGIYYYRNTVTTGSCGGLEFAEASSYWGGLASSQLCNVFDFAFSAQPAPGPLRPQHQGGFSLGLFDVDGDGTPDLLTGRDYCPELAVLRNSGTARDARFTRAQLNSVEPFRSQPALLPNYPAAFPVDVTFDGVPDVLVSSFLATNEDTIDTRQSVLLYRNAGTAAAPRLVREQNDFLQRDMLDVGELAAPTFGDLDGDGLVDMLVGGVSRRSGFYRAGLSYYRNVGTATQPVFQLMTDDYLGLSRQKLGFLRPVLTDLNEDGRLDLVYSAFRLGTTRNALTYVPNTAAAGQPAVFNLSAAGTLANLPTLRFALPAFADVDGDGHPDLLLGVTGDPAGPLHYYRNSGTGAVAQRFTLQQADFGQLRTGSGGRPTYLSPVVADFDGDGRPDLLTADADGDIRFFTDLRAQTGAFLGRTDVFYNPLTRQNEAGRWGLGNLVRYAPAAADVNADGVPELFLGLESGGISSFVGRNRVVTATQPGASALVLRLYPNPATTRVTVEAPRPVRLTLLDLTGRLVHAETAAARTHELRLAGLSAGVYLLRCRALTGEITVQRLVVGR
ncbi:T9SS type A sorting domain-containing protein [Hymenobacter sp. NST-14]|uniref:FG-GAP-like repeat-containing protein n=1 Tax=Hymenobacter piscis TaxID=2839984 RepID=UPI001C02902D|nr:FG-GAP-like repeat-containing protein [Hymenobacter piscis]MBT9393248.1 T9SS type A sorting domain-containing protein [Hymenobacter piscis]